jgi:sporulation protein YlmC with PRC-barrel domain
MNRSSTIGTWIALAALSIALAQAQVPTPTPQPSTDPAEGTAADRTPPGKTPTRDSARNTTVDPRPSTAETEGTTADRTSPGDSSRPGAGGARASTLVGAQVVTPTAAPIGKVVDVVFDTKDQPAFLVIASGGTQAAVPYAAASSMMSGARVVIDQSRLERAPKVKQGEWRNRSNDSWKADAASYWLKDQRKEPQG